MKKIFKLLLVFIMTICFSGCSSNDEVRKIELGKENNFEDVFSFQIESVNKTKELTPDIIQGIYTYYQPSDEGNVLLDTVMLITNLNDSDLKLDEQINGSIVIEETEYKCVIKMVNGSGFSSDNIIKGKETAKVHFYIEVSPKLLNKQMKLKITSLKDEDICYELDFKLKDIAKEYEGKKISDTLVFKEESEIVLKAFNNVDTLQPTKPSGLYNYYQAKQGNKLVVLTTEIKNISSSEKTITNLATIKIVDQDGLEHPGYMIHEKDNQSDLIDGNKINFASGQSGTVHFVFELDANQAKEAKTIKISNKGKVYIVKC